MSNLIDFIQNALLSTKHWDVHIFDEVDGVALLSISTRFKIPLNDGNTREITAEKLYDILRETEFGKSRDLAMAKQSKEIDQLKKYKDHYELAYNLKHGRGEP